MMKKIYRKILVGFDKDLFKRIDRESKMQKLNRNKFIRKAIKAYILSEEFSRAEGLEERD